MKKRIKGFTLVELIVVIAIIGVLAAILVPSMMGYVKNSRLKSANANAKIVYNAANAYATNMEIQGKTINESFIVNPMNCDLEEGKAEKNELKEAICEALSGNGSGSGWAYLNFDKTSGDFNGARWTKDKDSDSIVGQYPNPPQDYTKCPTLEGSNWDIITE